MLFFLCMTFVLFAPSSARRSPPNINKNINTNYTTTQQYCGQAGRRAGVSTNSKYKNKLPFRIASINSPQCPPGCIHLVERASYNLFSSLVLSRRPTILKQRPQNIKIPLTPTGSCRELQVLLHMYIMCRCVYCVDVRRKREAKGCPRVGMRVRAVASGQGFISARKQIRPGTRQHTRILYM